MGYESRLHLNAEDLTPLEKRLQAIEIAIGMVNDKVDFVLNTASAAVTPPGSELAITPVKPQIMPLAELYRMVREQGVRLQLRGESAPQTEQSPEDAALGNAAPVALHD